MTEHEALSPRHKESLGQTQKTGTRVSEGVVSYRGRGYEDSDTGQRVEGPREGWILR